MKRFAEQMAGMLGGGSWVGAHGVCTNPGLNDLALSGPRACHLCSRNSVSPMEYPERRIGQRMRLIHVQIEFASLSAKDAMEESADAV
jgi:hypothetical protein